MVQKTKIENEIDRIAKETAVYQYMRNEYLARKQLLICELKEINEQLDQIERWNNGF